MCFDLPGHWCEATEQKLNQTEEHARKLQRQLDETMNKVTAHEEMQLKMQLKLGKAEERAQKLQKMLEEKMDKKVSPTLQLMTLCQR